jgi:type IX secretion system substrate protein
MKNKFYILAVFAFFFVKTIAQQQSYHWYFGNNAGLDFSSGTAVAVSNGALETNEGCSSISDAGGNLLFYTDGVNVYNKLHQAMPNGNNLFGHYSSTQSALIVQKPGTIDHYFIFTTDAGEYVDPPNDGLHYSEVDMNLNSGTGDIVAASKNTLLLATATEKLCGTLHANGTDIWVVAHGWNDSTFYAYLVTNAGVGTVPVTAATGLLHGGSDDNTIGQMKFSPQGNKLALAVRIAGFFELFDFNTSTGMVSNPVFLQIPQFLSAYGVEFSPDGSRLYVSTDSFTSLYQYDLSSGNATAIINSLLTVGTISGGAGSLQLAPDGKIYVAHYLGATGNQYLGRINSPDSSGTGCNYVNNAVNLGTGKSFLGLPNYISSYFLPTGISTQNFSNIFSVHFDPANHSLKISHTVFINSNLTVKISDISGRQIYTAGLIKDNSEFILPRVKTGIYIVQIGNKEMTFNKKIFIAI